MDAIIHHWVIVLAAIEAGTEVLSLFIRYLAEYFYANDRPRHLNPTGEAEAGVLHTYRPLRPGRTQAEYAEDSENGLPAMARACQDVSGGVCEAGDGDRSNVLVAV